MLTQDLAVFFCGDLNPVASKAQKIKRYEHFDIRLAQRFTSFHAKINYNLFFAILQKRTLANMFADILFCFNFS